jgi:hypothetical protein
MTTTTNDSTTATVETLAAEVCVLMAHSRGGEGITLAEVAEELLR